MAKAASKPFDIGGENWGKAHEACPGFWVIATRHHPAGSKFNPEINNRCLVLKLNDASAGGKPVLLIVNAVDGAAMAEVRHIEKQTKLKAKYLIAPGAGHSLHLLEWHDAFPEITVLAGPVRIPRVAAGKKLASSKRFRIFDQNDPLPMFKGQLEAVNFDGIGGFREIHTPYEGGKDSMFGMIKTILGNMPPKDPHDELWLYHVASRTVFGGENLGWNLGKKELAAMNFMMKMMMKSEQVYIMTGPRPVLDKAKVAAHWAKILSWPAENLFSYHDTLGTGQVGGAQAALRAAVVKAKQIAA
jgi:hypothetical protein